MADHDTQPPHPQVPLRRHWGWRRWLVLSGIAALVVAAGLFWGVPWLEQTWNTVSTDDAYVNSHVTNLSARIGDFVIEVLVDDSDKVEAGMVLVRLDRVPYELAVAQKQAALDVAQAELTQAMAQVRAQESQARASWFKLVATQDQVRSLIATLRSNVAQLELKRANRSLAQVEFTRVERLVPTGAAAPEERDVRRNALQVAEREVTTAEEGVQQTRANLGLPRNRENPLDVPKDLDQNFPDVQVALSNVMMALAQIGIALQLHGLTPDLLYQDLLNWTPSHDLNRTLDELVQRSPSTWLAQEKVKQTEKDLEWAQLQLSYTEIRAPISGVVVRRTVNPGDNIQVGQNLLALRSLDVWVDANFKKTQVRDVRIGQPVDVYVDAYPDRVFKGRVAGFSPGTGSTLSLLPPENATGNFVKIVQRLPVRIELEEPNRGDEVLFAGLSVVPYVRIHEPATGPSAGQRLRIVAPGEGKP